MAGERDHHKQKKSKTAREQEDKPKLTAPEISPQQFREICIAFREEIEERRAAFELKKKRGKLTHEDKIQEICARIGDEGLSLVQACRGIMARSWFNKCVADDKDLQDSYARACTDREELYFDLIESVAFKREEDHTAFTGLNVIQRDKLIIDVLKWKLARMNPKYGDKLDIKADVKETVQILLDLGEDDED